MENDEIETTNEMKPKKLIQNIRNETCVNQKDSVNWMIYQLFLKKNYDECLETINKYSVDKDGIESQFSIYLRALIKRYKGEVNESLNLLRKCYNLNDSSISVMKEIGKSLLLLGKFKMSIEIYDEILSRNEDDWEAYQEKGLCNLNIQDYEMASACFNKALEICYNDQTLIYLGKLAIMQEDYKTALDRYQDAVTLCPDNSELLSAIGAIHLKLGNSSEAFDTFGNAIIHDSTFSNALLGIASIYQDKGEYEQALIKYKLASFSNPNSPLVWNNLGLCFSARGKNIAAVTCLKKANYLDPFEWIVSYNLGLLYLQQKQLASAFHYMNSAANLKSDFHLTYMYLGIILSQLNDIYNAIGYYDRSLELNQNYLTYYNYTISLINNDMIENAKDKFKTFYEIFSRERDENSEYDKEIIENSEIIKEKLFS
jgi:Bardet-Biedl syndrome 4 protein